jgi:glycosyltransferase involved in cell wall biosynthesis
MRQEPYFSIVVPTHNRAELIDGSLRSLQRQTFANFECIVVDDGGSDDTEARVQDLNDVRFRYVWKEHSE